ncbi:MAG: undecaprenyl-diphosphate phosphatase [Nanoarchaeota archaeon]
MIEWLKILILAVVQGITEWLPISSSGHLVIFQRLLDYNASVMFDVALHFGTLMAVFVYFGREIVDIVEALFKGKWNSENGKMGLLLIVSAIPAAVFGYLFKEVFESAFSSFLLVGIGFGITGLILFIVSFDFRKNVKKMPSWIDSVLIGFAQALAIFPGISRSGSTISAGLLRGMDTKNAMKFSFLMSIPVIFGAGILEIGNNALPHELIWATLVAFVVGLASIHFLLKVISKDRKNLRWFGVYALLLAILVVGYSILK